MKESCQTDWQQTCARNLESSLQDIVSPLTSKLSLEFSDFTVSEIQIANLIKQGRTTKEMATLFNLSERTIEFHRRNFRRKLGIEKKKVSLSAYLLSIK